MHIIGVIGRWRSDGEEEEVFRLVVDTTRGLILEKNDGYEEGPRYCLSTKAPKSDAPSSVFAIGQDEHEIERPHQDDSNCIPDN